MAVSRTELQARLSDRVREAARRRSTELREEVVDFLALREALNLTQSQLAAEQGISQPAISKIERDGDMKVSRLAALVRSFGGRLEVKAHFDDGTEVELLREVESA